MADRSFIQENEAARLELSELIARLNEHSFALPVGSGWIVSTSLCHLAFWDQRVLFLLRQWESGRIDTSRLGSQSVESINYAVNAISHAVAGPAAAELALNSPSAVESHLAAISDELIDQLISTGFERYLRRCLHRYEHLRKIRQALDGQPVGIT